MRGVMEYQERIYSGMKGGADGVLKVAWRRELRQRKFCGIERSEARIQSITIRLLFFPSCAFQSTASLQL